MAVGGDWKLLRYAESRVFPTRKARKHWCARSGACVITSTTTTTSASSTDERTQPGGIPAEKHRLIGSETSIQFLGGPQGLLHVTDIAMRGGDNFSSIGLPLSKTLLHCLNSVTPEQFSTAKWCLWKRFLSIPSMNHYRPPHIGIVRFSKLLKRLQTSAPPLRISIACLILHTCAWVKSCNSLDALEPVSGAGQKPKNYLHRNDLVPGFWLGTSVTCASRSIYAASSER